MKKKGISKLVSVILIVVFVIAVSIFIFGWMIDVTKQGTEKSGDKGTAQDLCRDNVEIRLNKIWYEEDKLKIDIENLKKQRISNFVVRLEGANKIDVKKINKELGGYERSVFSVTGSNIDVVKIIPQIILKKPDILSVDEGWWLCSDKTVVYNM